MPFVVGNIEIVGMSLGKLETVGKLLGAPVGVSLGMALGKLLGAPVGLSLGLMLGMEDG